jgi:hypothetical protein
MGKANYRKEGTAKSLVIVALDCKFVNVSLNCPFFPRQDVVGFNLAGLQFLQRQLEDRDVTFFGETREKLTQVRKKKKTAVRKFQ